VLAILFLINFYLTEKLSMSSEREESRSYECGFEHNSLSRVPFSIRYFLLTAVFLVFDLEIVLLLIVPGFLRLSCSPGVVLFVRSIFVIVLFFGLLYE
jgi:NADH-ubiquinone oxidoreductase chain 3